MPNPLRLAVIARHHFDDVRLPFPPAWMQRMGLALGAPVGRVLGYRATYVPAAVDSAAPVTERLAMQGRRLKTRLFLVGLFLVLLVIAAAAWVVRPFAPMARWGAARSAF